MWMNMELQRLDIILHKFMCVLSSLYTIKRVKVTNCWCCHKTLSSYYTSRVKDYYCLFVNGALRFFLPSTTLLNGCLHITTAQIKLINLSIRVYKCVCGPFHCKNGYITRWCQWTPIRTMRERRKSIRVNMVQQMSNKKETLGIREGYFERLHAKFEATWDPNRYPLVGSSQDVCCYRLDVKITITGSRNVKIVKTSKDRELIFLGFSRFLWCQIKNLHTKLKLTTLG